MAGITREPLQPKAWIRLSCWKETVSFQHKSLKLGNALVVHPAATEPQTRQTLSITRQETMFLTTKILNHTLGSNVELEESGNRDTTQAAEYPVG